jgi:hypothetical protein
MLPLSYTFDVFTSSDFLKIPNPQENNKPPYFKEKDSSFKIH